jgi:hypothetical protein
MAHEAIILASHPQFIALAYRLIENAIKKSNIPSRTYGVIGGAASIIHRCHHHDIPTVIASLDRHTRTTDIDLALWYHKRLNKDDFLKYNKKMMEQITKKFVSPFVDEWKYIIEQIIQKELDSTFTITCVMENMRQHEEMTGKINIIFTLYGKQLKLIELIIHNMIYSQDRNPDFTERIMPINDVRYDITYLDKATTTFIPIDMVGDEVKVTVPKMDILLQQYYFVYGNVLLNWRSYHEKSTEKYMERMQYLLPHVSKQCHRILCVMEKYLETELHKTGRQHYIHKIKGLDCSRPRSAYYGPPKKGGTRKPTRTKRTTRKHYTT